MNAETMMVDPNELVIDMPLDEANVNTKAESMRNNGMIQDVTVWLQDMRIIDGFHRTEAARRLGLPAIRCKVVDCSEAAFWDARIQSARQHQTVERKRLESWIISCWDSTEWDEELILDEVERLNEDSKGIFDMVLSELRYKSDLGADSFRSCNLKPNRQTEILSALKVDGVTTWHQLANISDDELRQKFNLNKTQLNHIRWRQQWNTKKAEPPIDEIVRRNGTKAAAAAIAAWNVLTKGRDLSEKEMPSIYSWFKEKSAQWGDTPSYLARVILESNYVGYVGSRLADGYEQQMAKELDLSLSEACLLSPYMPDVYVVNTQYASSPQKAIEPLKEFLNNRQTGQSLAEYRQQRASDAELELQQAALEQQRAIERRQAWEQTEAGKEAARKALIENSRGYMKDLLLSARDGVASCKYHMVNVPDAPAVIAEFAQFVADFAAEHFPNVQIAQPNPVALENSRLRSENAKLKERIASLERALGSKQAAGEMLSSAMAWSSEDMR